MVKIGDSKVEEAFKDGTTKNYNTTVETCTCSFWKSYNIPCRHILFVRKELKIDMFAEERK